MMTRLMRVMRMSMMLSTDGFNNNIFICMDLLIMNLDLDF